MDWQAIRLLILDVDGVLTNGRIEFSAEGEPAKAFCIQDGCAIKAWQKAGGAVAILSGRKERSVERRATELGIEHVAMGVEDKSGGYEKIMRATGRADESAAYVGDDLPDLGPMKRCRWPVAVANAVPEVKRAAAYVTRRRGGDGAVAEVVELLLRKQGRWPKE